MLITAASTALLTLVFVIFVIIVLNLAMRPSGESLPKQSPKAEPKSSTLPQKLEEGPDGFAMRGTRVLHPGRAFSNVTGAWGYQVAVCPKSRASQGTNPVRVDGVAG